MKRRDKNKLSKAQKERIERACKKFKNETQEVVNGPDIDSISMQIGNGPKMTLASKKS